jgi:hypothetical protein
MNNWFSYFSIFIRGQEHGKFASQQFPIYGILQVQGGSKSSFRVADKSVLVITFEGCVVFELGYCDRFTV